MPFDVIPMETQLERDKIALQLRYMELTDPSRPDKMLPNIIFKGGKPISVPLEKEIEVLRKSIEAREKLLQKRKQEQQDKIRELTSPEAVIRSIITSSILDSFK